MIKNQILNNKADEHCTHAEDNINETAANLQSIQELRNVYESIVRPIGTEDNCWSHAASEEERKNIPLVFIESGFLSVIEALLLKNKPNASSPIHDDTSSALEAVLPSIIADEFPTEDNDEHVSLSHLKVFCKELYTITQEAMEGKSPTFLKHFQTSKDSLSEASAAKPFMPLAKGSLEDYSKQLASYLLFLINVTKNTSQLQTLFASRLGFNLSYVIQKKVN